MAKAVEVGHRVVLVTGTRGELGEIVVPEMDTPDNHRRLGEIRRRAGTRGDPASPSGEPGHRDSGMMGTDGKSRPAFVRMADRRGGPTAHLAGRQYRPDAPPTTSSADTGTPTTSDLRCRVRAFARAGDPAWYPNTEEPWGWRRGRRRGCTSRPSRPASINKKMTSSQKPWWSLPDDATPERSRRWRIRAKMLVPDERSPPGRCLWHRSRPGGRRPTRHPSVNERVHGDAAEGWREGCQRGLHPGNHGSRRRSRKGPGDRSDGPGPSGGGVQRPLKPARADPASRRPTPSRPARPGILQTFTRGRWSLRAEFGPRAGQTGWTEWIYRGTLARLFLRDYQSPGIHAHRTRSDPTVVTPPIPVGPPGSPAERARADPEPRRP